MSDDGYLTTADALAYLRTTPRTLYRRLATGEIPAVRMGRQWRFRKSDLDRWVEQRASCTRPSAERESPDRAEAAPNPRVLLAGDDPALFESLASILRVTGCDVESASDGDAAIVRLRAQSYDLVITALRMSGADGIGVAREAKRLWPRIKVVIVTAHPSQSSAIDAINIGVDGYVTKPFRAIDVLITIARALDLGPAASQYGRGT